MKILKTFCIIFVLHLIPVVWIFYQVGLYPEAVMCWLLFVLLDFPLGWMFFVAMPMWQHPFNDFWNSQLAPALFFQIVGSINWLLIYLILCSVFKMVKRFFVMWFTPME